MYKVAIIDDEQLARQLLANFITKNGQLEIVAECSDGFDGFKAIQQHKPDLIFLDIQMPKLSGFEMLELLDDTPSVIFTTAFDEYAMKAFDAHAVDYLLKPVTKDRFNKAIEKFLIQTEKVSNSVKKLAEENIYGGYQHRIVVKDNGMIRIIPADEIQYIEANDDYIKIHTETGQFLKKSTLTGTEKSLDPKQFIRVHRSYLVPVRQILRIEPYEKDSHVAIMECGDKVPVSKSGMEKLKSSLRW